jgi:hypothetical protein
LSGCSAVADHLHGSDKNERTILIIIVFAPVFNVAAADIFQEDAVTVKTVGDGNVDRVGTGHVHDRNQGGVKGCQTELIRYIGNRLSLSFP